MPTNDEIMDQLFEWWDSREWEEPEGMAEDIKQVLDQWLTRMEVGCTNCLRPEKYCICP